MGSSLSMQKKLDMTAFVTHQAKGGCVSPIGIHSRSQCRIQVRLALVKSLVAANKAFEVTPVDLNAARFGFEKTHGSDTLLEATVRCVRSLLGIG